MVIRGREREDNIWIELWQAGKHYDRHVKIGSDYRWLQSSAVRWSQTAGRDGTKVPNITHSVPTR